MPTPRKIPSRYRPQVGREDSKKVDEAISKFQNGIEKLKNLLKTNKQFEEEVKLALKDSESDSV